MKGFSYQISDFRKKLTLTIFSAPNYCDTYRNKGGVAIIKVEHIFNLERFFDDIKFQPNSSSIRVSELHECFRMVFANYSNKNK